MTLILIADWSVAAAVGFFISIQFASGISWLAAAGLDVTGLGSSVVFMVSYSYILQLNIFHTNPKNLSYQS